MEIKPEVMLDLINWLEVEETNKATLVCIRAFPRCTREQNCEISADYFALLKIDGKVELCAEERKYKSELARICGSCETCARKIRGLADQFGW